MWGKKMIDQQNLNKWLAERIKDESDALELLSRHPQARAMTFGAREAYLKVLFYLNGELDD